MGNERPTNSRNAGNYIGAIHRAAVPNRSSSMSCFNEKYIGIKIISSDGHSFIQEAMKVLNTNSLVVALSNTMNGDVKDSTDFFEETFEHTAVINNNQSAKADFRIDVLNQ